MKVRFNIKRYDPEGGDRRRTFYQAYDVTVTEGMTVLEGLLKIADEMDPSLSFRRSCRSAICGSCAMNISGFTKLACNTQILPVFKKHGEVFIEPLPNHTVLKDLVVEFADFWNKLDKVVPYLTPSEEAEKGECVIRKKDSEAIDKVQQCIMCGCCNGACNALEVDKRYSGPAALAKSWRFVGDVREGKSSRRLARLSEDHGMWDCVRCVHCTEYCPKGVAPLEAIESLRSKAVDMDLTDNHGAKHVTSMVESVKKLGRLDEAAMTFKTLGFIRSLGMIPFGFKMQLHGKMPHLHLFPSIDNIDEVKKIYEAYEKKKDSQGKKEE